MYVSDLDEVPGEEKEVRRVEGDRSRNRLPIDGSEVSRGLSVLLDVESEGCEERKKKGCQRNIEVKERKRQCTNCCSKGGTPSEVEERETSQCDVDVRREVYGLSRAHLCRPIHSKRSGSFASFGESSDG